MTPKQFLLLSIILGTVIYKYFYALDIKRFKAPAPPFSPLPMFVWFDPDF